MAEQHEGFARFPREFARLNDDQKGELAWRSTMRLLPFGLRFFHPHQSLAILRQLLAAHLLIAGRVQDNILRLAVDAPVAPFGDWYRRSGSPYLDAAASRTGKALLKMDKGGAFAAIRTVIDTLGMPGKVAEGHFVLHDIRQITDRATQPWLPCPSDLPKVLPLLYRHTSGAFPPGEGQPLHPFWQEWYRRTVTGQPLNWDLLTAVARIDDALWRQGGAALEARIDALLEDQALVATENGERVEINPETGKLRLVTDKTLPDDIQDQVRRSMIRASQIFAGASSQSYGALTTDLDMLRHEAADNECAAIGLYDACNSARLRLQQHMALGNCPTAQQDPLFNDYQRRLGLCEADILGWDSRAGQIVARRAALPVAAALSLPPDQTRAVVAAALPLAEGRLAQSLQGDTALATDPDMPAELREVAARRLLGRLLRVTKALAVMGSGFVIGVRLITGTAEYLAAIILFADQIRTLGF